MYRVVGGLGAQEPVDVRGAGRFLGTDKERGSNTYPKEATTKRTQRVALLYFF